MKHPVKTPAGVSKESAAAIKAENSLLVNVPNNETIKSDKKGGQKNDANLVTEKAVTISAVNLCSDIVFDVIRRYSGIILPAIYDKTAAAGLLKSKAEKAAIIEAAVNELQKAVTIEAVCKSIERADKKAATIEAEREKAAKAAAERKAEREAKKTAKNNAVNAAKKAAKMSKAEFIEEKTRYYIDNGVNAELAANLANNDYNNMFRK
jgi:hypothetical protein